MMLSHISGTSHSYNWVVCTITSPLVRFRNRVREESRRKEQRNRKNQRNRAARTKPFLPPIIGDENSNQYCGRRGPWEEDHFCRYKPHAREDQTTSSEEPQGRRGGVHRGR